MSPKTEWDEDLLPSSHTVPPDHARVTPVAPGLPPPAVETRTEPVAVRSHAQTPGGGTPSQVVPETQIPVIIPSVGLEGSSGGEVLDDNSFYHALERRLGSSATEFLQIEAFAAKRPIEDLIEARRLLPSEELLQLLSEFFRIPRATTLKPDVSVLQKNVLFFLTNNILPLSPTEFVIAAPRNATIYRRNLAKEGFGSAALFLGRKGAIARALRPAILSLRHTAKHLQDRIATFVTEGEFSKAVNDLISYAFRLYASDLHFENFGTHGQIRARVDGILEALVPVASTQYEKLIGALYTLTKSAQPSPMESGDGAFPVDGLPLQVRVSYIPALKGKHNAVLRLLPTSSDIPTGEDLGYTTEKWGQLLAITKRATSGLILFVGPTGSGKNTSLFSLISSLDTRGKKLIEVADPIEYQHLLGVQAQLSETGDRQWTYPDALRAALRHDPDIIFVGEIRDSESAKIALDAARTGHLIFSTVHAESAFEAFDRLVDLGCSASYLLATMRLVISQRLFRRTCPNCFGKGCPACFGGYTGRVALAEVLEVSDELRDSFGGVLPLTKSQRVEAAKRVDPGYMTLPEVVEGAIHDNITSFAEAMRVLGFEDRRRLSREQPVAAVPPVVI